MNFSLEPDPVRFAKKLAKLHTRGKSPTGMFGFTVPTALGKFERTVRWEKSWAKCFTNQLEEVIGCDNEVIETWPGYDAACTQLIDIVIPRVLGVLQSEGRSIAPALIHGDLWEQNVGIKKDTNEAILFDPGRTYAHNEMEFGTWRCSWATYFRFRKRKKDDEEERMGREEDDSELGRYLKLYKERVGESEPKEEWDDRNRLYSIHPNLNNCAGHPGEATGTDSEAT
jgi:protein-ribulosamine 3-kinase